MRQRERERERQAKKLSEKNEINQSLQDGRERKRNGECSRK